MIEFSPGFGIGIRLTVPNDGEWGSLPILSFAIKECMEGRPDTWIVPVFTENIRWVMLTGRVDKPRNGSTDC